MNRRLLVVAGVLLLHLGALWALQSGLLHRVAEVVVPVQILGEWVPPAAPEAPAPRHRPAPTPPRPRPAIEPPPPPVATPAPAPIAVPVPAPRAPAPPVAPLTAPPLPANAVASPPAGPAPPTASAPVELPSSNAAYLNNPKPGYPALSRRLGEQGRVVVHVLIGVDGRALQAEIAQSSGYERLDRAALATVRSWRYVPGTRGGVPEAMWFDVPIQFVLE